MNLNEQNVAIKLVSTSEKDGRFSQTWEVNGQTFDTNSEFGDIESQSSAEDVVVVVSPRVTAADVISLAIHGNGPTEDGETKVWGGALLVEVLREGGYVPKPEATATGEAS